MKAEEIQDGVREHLNAATDQVYREAKAIADRYWSAWVAKNKQEISKPAAERSLGRFGIVVTRSKLNNKVYIEWRDFSPTKPGPRKKGKVFGRSIAPLAGRNYRETQFKKARIWEKILILKAEPELSALRDVNEAIHSALVSLNRTRRKFEWQIQTTSDSPSLPEQVTTEMVDVTLEEMYQSAE